MRVLLIFLGSMIVLSAFLPNLIAYRVGVADKGALWKLRARALIRAGFGLVILVSQIVSATAGLAVFLAWASLVAGTHWAWRRRLHGTGA